MTILSLRTLNRTLLARQMLLDRGDLGASALMERLVGMQAQNPIDPYVSMWTRVRDFDALKLSALIENRKAVRASLMRSTIHLVTARDCLAFRPLLQTRLERTFYAQAWGKAVAGLDIEAILQAGRELVQARPHTTSEFRRAIIERFPLAETDALVALMKHIVPTVQVPPRGLWGKTAHPAWASMEDWLGRPLPKPRPDRFLLRYLAAFGPATIADFRNWSGLTGYTDVVDRLRPKLRTFRDEDGRELLDTLDAPMADPDAPAPPRFFPDYDNVFLGHADRSRIVDGPTFKENTLGTSSFSFDGFLAGTWKLDRKKTSVTMLIEPWRTISKKGRETLAVEAEMLLSFLKPDAKTRDLRFV